MSVHSSRGAAWNTTRLAVLERDGYICAYCGKGPLVGDDATVDHIIAANNGGDDSPSNLITSCRSDNSAKGARVAQRMAGFNPNWLQRVG